MPDQPRRLRDYTAFELHGLGFSDDEMAYLRRRGWRPPDAARPAKRPSPKRDANGEAGGQVERLDRHRRREQDRVL